MKKSTCLMTIFVLFVSFAVYANMQAGVDALKAKNYSKAFNEFLPEAKTGNADAQNYIGNLYSAGLGVRQDYKQAFSWYLKSATANNIQAMNNLANMYETGHGVKQDYKKAVEFYKKASSFGLVGATYNLAQIYYSGHGVKQDYKKAVDLLNKAAEAGLPNAQSLLGTIYYFGSLGEKVNYKKAYQLINEAALQGFTDAQLSLGSIYKEGKAVKQNYTKAYMWYYIAYKSGNKKPLVTMNALEKSMPPKQVTLAKHQAEHWIKTHKEIDTKLNQITNTSTQLPINKK